MSAFKEGDRVLVEGVVRFDDGGASILVCFANELRGYVIADIERAAVSLAPSPPPAPKVEREAVPSDELRAVPEDARVGDVYERANRSATVVEVSADGSYACDVGNHITRGFVRGCHSRAMGWCLVTRGPAPVPAPEAKREWQKGEPVTNSEVATFGVAKFTRYEGSDHCIVQLEDGEPARWQLRNLRPAVRELSADEATVLAIGVDTEVARRAAASPPEPATMTAAATKACHAFEEVMESSPNAHREAWHAAAQAAIDIYVAAQPATEAKAREVVGYYLRDTQGEPTHFGLNGWNEKEKCGAPIKRDACVDEWTKLIAKWGHRADRFALVKVTRRVPR